MAQVYIDRDGDQFAVRVMTGIAGDKTTRFPEHVQAVAFAEQKMGRRGMILDSSQMTAEQLAAHRERQARIAAFKAEHGIPDRVLLDNGRAFAPSAARLT